MSVVVVPTVRVVSDRCSGDPRKGTGDCGGPMPVAGIARNNRRGKYHNADAGSHN
jgi:hypothetical protein